MFKCFDWECERCHMVNEFLTPDGRPPSSLCPSCGSVQWARRFPGPATTFKHAGRFIPKKGTSVPPLGTETPKAG